MAAFLIFLRLLKFAIIAFLVYYLLKKFLRMLKTQKNTHSYNKNTYESSKQNKKSNFDPYSILEVSASASWDEIKQSYHNKLKAYHPDKVSHLGEDLQTLAQEKTQEINFAYETLKTKHQTP